MPLIDFTREQIPELRKIIRSEINSIINTQNRPSVIDDGHQAPEVYVALVPEDGIPPVNFDGTGTGSFIADTGDSGDVPGSAVCEIYFLDVNLLELKSTGRSETVYNLETLNISGPKWISIHRDKYGRWFAVSSGGVCDVTNEIQHIVIFGQPTRGTFDVSLTLADPDDLDPDLFSIFKSHKKVITKPDTEQLANVRTGVTDAFCGVASTGSVCVSISKNLSSPVSMLTRKHIAVVDAQTIVPRPRDLFSEEIPGGKGLKRSFSFITGPSATADMGPLVRGVHGPGKLHIIILE